MRLRVDDPMLIAELQVYLRDRGFLVVPRDDHCLDVHLLHHANHWFDRRRAREALAVWLASHSEATVAEII